MERVHGIQGVHKVDGFHMAHSVKGGYVLSGIAAAFLAMDTIMKLVLAAPAVEGTAQLGFPTSLILPLGIVEALCLLAYLVPRTSVLGAVLFTGYLGGAIATHVRLENPLFTHTLFPIYVAVLVWGGLWLREPRLRALLPLRGDVR